MLNTKIEISREVRLTEEEFKNGINILEKYPISEESFLLDTVYIGNIRDSLYLRAEGFPYEQTEEGEKARIASTKDFLNKTFEKTSINYINKFTKSKVVDKEESLSMIAEMEDLSISLYEAEERVSELDTKLLNSQHNLTSCENKLLNSQHNLALYKDKLDETKSIISDMTLEIHALEEEKAIALSQLVDLCDEFTERDNWEDYLLSEIERQEALIKELKTEANKSFIQRVKDAFKGFLRPVFAR